MLYFVSCHKQHSEIIYFRILFAFNVHRLHSNYFVHYFWQTQYVKAHRLMHLASIWFIWMGRKFWKCKLNNWFCPENILTISCIEFRLKSFQYSLRLKDFYALRDIKIGRSGSNYINRLFCLSSTHNFVPLWIVLTT